MSAGGSSLGGHNSGGNGSTSSTTTGSSSSTTSGSSSNSASGGTVGASISASTQPGTRKVVQFHGSDIKLSSAASQTVRFVGEGSFVGEGQARGDAPGSIQAFNQQDIWMEPKVLYGFMAAWVEWVEVGLVEHHLSYLLI